MRLRLAVCLLAILFMCVGSVEATDTRFADDLKLFRSDFFEVDNSYSAEAKQQAGKLLDAMEKNAATLTAAEFELGLAQIVALADNGHTLALVPRWTKEFNRLPLSFLIADDKLYVADAPEHRSQEGSEVVSLGGHSFAQLEQAWSKYQGGEPGWRREFIYFFIESPELLHTAGLIDSPVAVSLELKDAQGKTATLSVTARRDLEPLQGREAYLPPARAVVLARSKDGKHASPLYLQDPAEAFHYEPMNEGKVAYIRLRMTSDSPSQKIKPFLEATTKALKKQKPTGIVLDMRHNSGGDLNTTRSFMQSLPKIVGENGHVVAIASGRTFSAAISSIGYLKQAGGDQVSIVGEPVGDRLEFWAEGSLVQLPTSGAAFLYATERHNYNTGCPEDDCHGSIQRHPIRVESLMPDQAVPLTWEAFAAGRDPMLEAALKLLG